MSFLAELGFLFLILSCNSWTLGCALPSPWETIWELDLLGHGFQSCQRSLWLEARGFLGSGMMEWCSLITSLHSSEYWVSEELPSWHSNEHRTSVGTTGCDQVMQVCHATNPCDRQGRGRAFGKHSCQQSGKFICHSRVLPCCGQATEILMRCLPLDLRHWNIQGYFGHMYVL